MVKPKPWATCSLVVTNLVAYAICARIDDSATPRIETLLSFGALTKDALVHGQTWRLVAAGFLHANLVHLASNMICLALWGSLLETRIGTLNLILVYATSLVASSAASVATHPGPFVGVGASGAVAGVFGALVALYVLGKIELSITFVVANIAINIGLAASTPNIDWRAHLGGFTAGLLGCALLDAWASAGRLLFRSRFPEFVRLNGIGLIALAAVWAKRQGFGVGADPNLAIDLVVAGLVALLAMKGLDLLLQCRKGLLAVGILFAVLNSAAPVAFSREIGTGFTWLAQTTNLGRRLGDGANLWSTILGRPAIDLIVALVFAGTLLVYRHASRRGWSDVGFVAATLQAEQKRLRGL